MGGLIDLLIIGFVIYGILRGLTRGKEGGQTEGDRQERSREWLEKLGLPVPPGPMDTEQERPGRTFEVETREGTAGQPRQPVATRQPGRSVEAEPVPRSVRLAQSISDWPLSSRWVACWT